MACESLIAYSRECGSKAGGVQRLWLLAYKDLGLIENTNSPYTVGVSGEITDVAFNGDARFVNVGIIKNTVGISETLTRTVETGTSEITTELTLVISQITNASRTFAQSLADGEIVALIQLRSGNYIIAGLDGGLEVSTIVGGSGTAGADLNGYTITLSGVENELLRLVDSNIVVDLTTAPTPPIGG